jgi:ribonuclease HII
MPDFRIESALAEQGFALVAGVDEAGRGPLAGPVVAAAVILPEGLLLDDSKRLSAQQREAAYVMIRRVARAYCTVAVGPAQIDRINILRATLEGMARAVQRLRVQPQYVLVDGNQLPPLALPCQAVVKGDRTCNSIAAASILAKVARDRIMTA